MPGLPFLHKNFYIQGNLRIFPQTTYRYRHPRATSNILVNSAPFSKYKTHSQPTLTSSHHHHHPPFLLLFMTGSPKTRMLPGRPIFATVNYALTQQRKDCWGHRGVSVVHLCHSCQRVPLGLPLNPLTAPTSLQLCENQMTAVYSTCSRRRRDSQRTRLQASKPLSVMVQKASRAVFCPEVLPFESRNHSQQTSTYPRMVL